MGTGPLGTFLEAGTHQYNTVENSVAGGSDGFVSITQLHAGPTPARAMGPHPHGLPALAFARADPFNTRVLSERLLNCQLSDRLSYEIVILRPDDARANEVAGVDRRGIAVGQKHDRIDVRGLTTEPPLQDEVVLG